MKKAFSLIELLIVIVIIAILSTLIIYSVGNAQAKARDAKRKSDIKAISVALEAYKSQKGRYPAMCATGPSFYHAYSSKVSFEKISVDNFGCTAGDRIYALLQQGYISSVPLDPSTQGNQGYYYYSDGFGKSYKILSYGPELLDAGMSSDACKKTAGEYYDPYAPCEDYQVSSDVATANGV